MSETTDRPDSGRRRFISTVGLVTAASAVAPGAFAQSVANLGLPGGPSVRRMTDSFPGKRGMILQRTHAPLLETPMEVFDKGVLTPNDQFFVRWHWADFPLAVDVNSFRLNVRGNVAKPLSLSLADILRMPRTEITAVNQCSGNSRGFFLPRVAGAQWGHGAMGNAKWMGVSVKRILEQAGVKPGSLAVRFNGMDQPTATDGPDFAKSLAVDHARDGEVMLAFAMNDEQLPLLNGFPLRLIVPGWYSTYWIKMLNDIEVLTKPDDNFWMAKAYKIPTAPMASVKPGTKDFPVEPIHRMIPRAWITNFADGAKVAYQPQLSVRGIAMGGDTGVARVELSGDGGRSWTPARLGADEGKYSFRRFEGAIAAGPRGSAASLMARCTSSTGEVQPMTPNWNPSGYMRGCVETVRVVAA